MAHKMTSNEVDALLSAIGEGDVANEHLEKDDPEEWKERFIQTFKKDILEDLMWVDELVSKMPSFDEEFTYRVFALVDMAYSFNEDRDLYEPKYYINSYRHFAQEGIFHAIEKYLYHLEKLIFSESAGLHRRFLSLELEKSLDFISSKKYEALSSELIKYGSS